ncbi:glycosyltransferase family 2 protein [Novosphingobium sp. Leaf2]|uniref:glycosyltransferase family 2 protein n=1 Tax=Novosphingobium sp. Leaf2 TaxID=1735670 RepID=UPI0006F532BE|nr:glycosyltransferase family A protein [Novosphingobium sp. Leaf2]KQM13774.1 hypothetical protein ASE49_11960 [Novosphingobium sp. Leaf2]
MSAPVVSVLMVARNAAPFIDAAIGSVREQTFSNLEIIVVDDASCDDTAKIASNHAAKDQRVRVMEGPSAGLSAVRNASLDAAQGRFAAVVDSDDIVHPRHVEWLLDGQKTSGAQVCATNMIVFQDGAPAAAFAQGLEWRQPRRIDVGEFIDGGMIGREGVSLGYLKPLFDLAFLRRHRLRYDQSLRIGEDFDLVLRAMLAGAQFQFLPPATYYYRKHAASISHRLAVHDLEGLLGAMAGYNPGERVCATALQARRTNLEATLQHLRAIEAIKAGRPWRALPSLINNSMARAMTFAAGKEAVGKRIAAKHAFRRRISPVDNAYGAIEQLHGLTSVLGRIVS